MDFASLIADPAFWVALAFVIFTGLLIWKKIPSKVAKTLDERADKIRAQLEEARALKEEAQSLLAQYQRKHRDARKEAEAMMKLALEEADLFAKEAEKNLEASFARQLKATEDKISQAELEAVKKVRIAAAEAAVNAASTVLKTQLKAGKHDKLVDEAIKDLDKRLN